MKEIKRLEVQQILRDSTDHILKGLIDMMENKKTRSQAFNGMTMCEYWITVLQGNQQFYNGIFSNDEKTDWFLNEVVK
jgi:hypothetical protein